MVWTEHEHLTSVTWDWAWHVVWPGQEQTWEWAWYMVWRGQEHTEQWTWCAFEMGQRLKIREGHTCVAYEAGVTLPAWEYSMNCDMTTQCLRLLLLAFRSRCGICLCIFCRIVWCIQTLYFFDRLSQWLRRLDGWHHSSQMHGSTLQWSMKIPWMHGETSWRNQHSVGTNCNRQSSCRPTLMSIAIWC